MENKRLSQMLEDQLLDGSDLGEKNEDSRSVKRYKANHSSSDTTKSPLKRMLQRQISSNSCSLHLSPITELSHNLRGTLLYGGETPKSRELRSYNSVSSSYDSGNSLDDEYMAMFEMEALEQVQLDKLPGDLDALISGQLKSSGHVPGRSVRRCLSMSDQQQQQQHLLAEKEESLDATPFEVAVGSTRKSISSPPASKQIRKVVSMNDADILSALADEPKLIGDLSKPCALPVLVHGVRHRDLKTISCETLARLMRGEFPQLQDQYQIIDCRYPYEFAGGHIRGAVNLYTRTQIREAFPAAATMIEFPPPGKRRIYIFHCEFSSERGPKLLRYLRSNDRNVHTHNYPSLDYPELYLLHNGYKEFYTSYADLCEPCNYVPMLAPAHNEEYRLFRAKTKSWQSADSDGGDSGIGGAEGNGGSSKSGYLIRGQSLRKYRSRLLYAE